MKKSISLLKSVIILLAVLSFTGCSKDESSPTNNSVELDGNNFTISTATMLGVSIDDDGHTAITMINSNGSTIKTLTIDVESFTRATIEGDYAYPEDTDKKLIDDWLTSYTIIDDDSQTTSTNLETGEVTITNNSGNNYTIDINLTMISGETFEGSYTGDFEVMFYNN